MKGPFQRSTGPKFQVLNLSAQGTVPTLANRLMMHRQQHGPNQASGSSAQSHGHSAIGLLVSTRQPTPPGPAHNEPLSLTSPNGSSAVPAPQHPLMAPLPLPPVQHQTLPQSQ